MAKNTRAYWVLIYYILVHLCDILSSTHCRFSIQSSEELDGDMKKGSGPSENAEDEHRRRATA
jgi:hypothetical protein